jgi:hypothetical protein
MLSYLGITQPEQQKRLGELKDDKNIGEQLVDLKGKVEKTMNKNKTELRNYRELTKFNDHLSKSYVANLRIIVDISKLLSGYNEFFDLFKSKLAEIDQELNIPISGDDFESMKRLTTDQMVQLNDTFKKQTGDLKRLYSKYGKQQEYNEVEQAELLYDKTRITGATAYAAIKSQQPVARIGGKKKKVTKKKETKK